MQSQIPDASDSHVSEGPAVAHIDGEPIKCTRTCRRRSASSGLVAFEASSRSVLGELNKALAANDTCSHALSELPNGKGGIIVRKTVYCKVGLYVCSSVYFVIYEAYHLLGALGQQ